MGSNSRNLPGCSTVIPQLDESKIPCEQYFTTDCVYASDMVDTNPLGIPAKSTMSEVLDKLICKLEEQNDIISKLNLKIEKLLQQINN